LLSNTGGGSTGADQNINIELYEIGDKVSDSLRSVAIFDQDVLSLGIAQISQSLPERINQNSWIFGIATDRDKTDSRDFRRLLRLGSMD